METTIKCPKCDSTIDFLPLYDKIRDDVVESLTQIIKNLKLKNKK